MQLSVLGSQLSGEILGETARSGFVVDAFVKLAGDVGFSESGVY